MLLPGIADYYKASFLAWTFTFDVQYMVFGVDAKNLKDRKTPLFSIQQK